MPDIVINKFLNLHRTAIPIDHPDRSVTRVKLEYPEEDVYLMYLICIDKGTDESLRNLYSDYMAWLTNDSFTDKAITEYISSVGCGSALIGRYSGGDFYYTFYNSSFSTADHKIRKFVGGSITDLATEAVDISGVYKFKLVISASSLTSYRNGNSISATDTDLVSGQWGIAPLGKGHPDSTHGHTLLARLLAPSSLGPKPKAILVTPVIGSGTDEDPIRPDMYQELKEISEVSGLSDFLYEEANRYYTLKNKGYSDEEIKALLGYIPQHQVDLGAVSWGVFELKKGQSTVTVLIYEDNPYLAGAIEKQKEHCLSKGGKVLTPPTDYSEAVEQYKQLKTEHPEWIAGKDNYVFQSTAIPEVEYFHVADFYYGELIEHKTHYDQLKRVPDYEIERRIRRTLDKLQRVTILTEERDKHINKLRTILRFGW